MILQSWEPNQGSLNSFLSSILAKVHGVDFVATCWIRRRWIIYDHVSSARRVFAVRNCSSWRAHRRYDQSIAKANNCQVTSAVTKPIASATMFGEQIRSISAAGAKLKDRIVLTKGVGMEGTLILMSDCRERIVKSGILSNAEIDKAISDLKFTVSVVKEALLAISNEGVNAMHDPTEGGLLNALYEMADACNLGFVIDNEKIHLREDTKKLCQFFKIDPLHLISSGALLLTVDPGKVDSLLKLFKENSIDAEDIGEIVEEGVNIVINNGQRLAAKRPVQDALWDAIGENKELSE